MPSTASLAKCPKLWHVIFSDKRQPRPGSSKGKSSMENGNLFASGRFLKKKREGHNSSAKFQDVNPRKSVKSLYFYLCIKMSDSYSSRELSKSKRMEQGNLGIGNNNRTSYYVQLSSGDFHLCSGAQSAWLRKLGGPLKCSHTIGQSILEPRSAHMNRANPLSILDATLMSSMPPKYPVVEGGTTHTHGWYTKET